MKTTLADIPINKRWPDAYSLKATVYLPVKPPNKTARSRVGLETRIPKELFLMLLNWTSQDVEKNPAHGEIMTKLNELLTLLATQPTTQQEDEDGQADDR